METPAKNSTKMPQEFTGSICLPVQGRLHRESRAKASPVPGKVGLLFILVYDIRFGASGYMVLSAKRNAF
jgi:hypothetical protein